MPKRSNSYQKLVLNITLQLAETSAKVEESAELWDHDSEQNREIDILITDINGSYEYKIGIECSTVARKIGAPGFSSILEKHRAVGINKTVIVSKSGFAKTAKRLAKKKGVDLVHFNDAEKRDWPHWLSSLQGFSLNHYCLNIGKSQIQCQAITTIKTFDHLTLKVKTEVDGFIPYQDFVYSLVYPKTHSMKPELNGKLQNHSWRFPNPPKLLDEMGNQALLNSLDVEITESWLENPITLEYKEFNGSPVAVGVSNEVDGLSQLGMIVSPMIEAIDGEPKVSISIFVDTGST